MSDKLFPDGVSKISQDRIKDLASSVYNKDTKDLSKEEIKNVILMDMATFPTKMTVSAAATRPTEVKYSTNNYHTSIDIDLSGVDKVLKGAVDGTEDPIIILDTYLNMKAALFNLIKIKHEGTENYIRSLLEKSMEKDGCPKVGRNA